MKKIAPLLMCFFMVTSAISTLAQSKTFNMEIKENKADCSGVGRMKCYLVKYHNSKDWEYFYAPIDNFDYSEGFRYKVKVKRSKLSNVPADASSYKYEVVKVISKKKIRDSNDQSEEITMIVKENRVDCTGVGRMKCYMVKYNNSKDWEYFYSGFQHFNYEEGYRYKLLVKRTKLKNVPADASSYTYDVIKVLSKTKAGNVKEENTALAFLEKHTWKLLSLRGKLQENSGAFMNFDIDKNSVSGNSSCNNYFGTVRFNGNKITFTNVGSTQKACLNDNIEREFFDLLSLNGLTYDIAEQTFNLYHEQKLIAIFGMTQKN
ncbi:MULTISPECIES: DUF4377 domain-containing protein [unclassified Sphingobacterium]|uniref:DUF4377 domain-containing protein n=1 Tax=unclassified Sphingobacterium TaxID=2609468 RepID=UPI0025D8A6A6|nr:MULTISPECIES: DUF4377 domain-containing protein [unclassified Sphingobacterium]